MSLEGNPDVNGVEPVVVFSPEERSLLARHRQALAYCQKRLTNKYDSHFIEAFKRTFVEMFPEDADIIDIVSHATTDNAGKVSRALEMVQIKDRQMSMPRAIYYRTRVLARLLNEDRSFMGDFILFLASESDWEMDPAEEGGTDIREEGWETDPTEERSRR